ncbi:MAG TPA: hypothetical protein VF815_11080 [Myxococcaceae bacterium]
MSNGSAEAFSKRLEALPEHLKVELLLSLMEPLNEQIASLHEALKDETRDERIAFEVRYNLTEAGPVARWGLTVKTQSTGRARLLDAQPPGERVTFPSRSVKSN